jgi:hypothetical protein
VGDTLPSLALHGSWVAGDFRIGRSDLDLLALLAYDPSASMLATLAHVHDLLEQDHPEWADHVEVDYVSAAAIRDVLAGVAADHVMVRISPASRCT